MRDSKLLGFALDRDLGKVHSFARFEVVPPNQPPKQSMLKVEHLRAEVERVIGLYLSIEYFSVGCSTGKLDIGYSTVKGFARTYRDQVNEGQGDDRAGRLHTVAKGAPASDVIRIKARRAGFEVASDRDRQLWKSTIGVKLKRLPVNMEQSLLKAADLRQSIWTLKTNLERVEGLLASPSTAPAIQAVRPRLVLWRDIAYGMSDCMKSDRLRLTRSATYREAFLMFYLVCSEDSETQRYCFEEMQH